jgi:hypothetical protein
VVSLERPRIAVAVFMTVVILPLSRLDSHNRWTVIRGPRQGHRAEGSAAGTDRRGVYRGAAGMALLPGCWRLDVAHDQADHAVRLLISRSKALALVASHVGRVETEVRPPVLAPPVVVGCFSPTDHGNEAKRLGAPVSWRSVGSPWPVDTSRVGDAPRARFIWARDRHCCIRAARTNPWHPATGATRPLGSGNGRFCGFHTGLRDSLPCL